LVGYLILHFLSDYISLFNRQESVNEAFQVRYNIWREAYDVFVEGPVLGIGTGNYRNHVALHSQDGYYLIDNEVVFYGTESGYLKILAEAGLIGLIAALLFVLKPVINAIQSFKKNLNAQNLQFLIAAVLTWVTAFGSLYTLSDKRIVILLASLLCLLIIFSKTEATVYDK
jgi:O-antigen ligase